jgi:hypothetical protein
VVTLEQQFRNAAEHADERLQYARHTDQRDAEYWQGRATAYREAIVLLNKDAKPEREARADQATATEGSGRNTHG